MYIPRENWPATATTLVSWLRPGGMLAVGLQNPHTDCMRMLDHFVGERFDVRDLTRLPGINDARELDVRVETVEASIMAPNLDVACAVAEFMLNLLPMSEPPPWEDLERYVERHFRLSDGGYRMSCDQDFLRVARPTSA
jgi:hypothetical protein